MTTTTNDALEVASTIKRQIGIDAWLAVSARDPRYYSTDDGTVTFSFRFGSRYGLAKWCEITYKRGADTYDMVAYKVHRNGVKKTLSIASKYEPDGVESASYSNVYFDMLPSLVRQANTIGELS